MNFSIFEDDGTLGGTLPDSRVVVLKGSTTPSGLFSPNFFDLAGYIKTGLENRGFSVIAVRLAAANWTGYAQNLEIELNVFNRHTSEEARVNAITAIEAYRANYGASKVFNNTTLSVAFDGYQAAGTNASNTKSPNTNNTNATNPPSAYDTKDRDRGSFLDSEFIKNMSFGLGVSAPVVVAGGALLLLLYLKR